MDSLHSHGEWGAYMTRGPCGSVRAAMGLCIVIKERECPMLRKDKVQPEKTNYAFNIECMDCRGR
jgi:hypothetical protein